MQVCGYARGLNMISLKYDRHYYIIVCALIITIII